MATIIIIFVLQVPASAESLQDNLVPQDTETRAVGEVDLKYNEYPQHRYELDTYVDTAGDWMPWNWADGAGKQIYIALMEVVNAIWSLNVLFANFTMLIVQEAFDLDFISGVVDQIAVAIQNVAGFGPSGFMSNGLWSLLVTFVIAIVGAWATYVGMVKRESSRAWGGLISSIVIFVFSLGFFSNSDEIVGGINNWSSNLQSDILGISASIVNPGASYNAEEGIAIVRNQMFDLMVKKPYILMQYGTTEVDEDRVNTILSIDPLLEAEKRQDEIKKEVEDKNNSMMSIDGITQRAAFVPLLFLGNTIIGLFLLMISGSIILYQMIFLALVLFAPVPLLMALVPKWQQTAFDWMMKVLHAQLMKIAIALLLTILFGISSILYRATETSDLGYLGMMVIQIICFVGIWAKRKELFNMVSTAANHVQSSTGASLQSYQKKVRQAKNAISNGQNMLDKQNNKGRIRNQPLTQRNKGSFHGSPLADRQKNLQGMKTGLMAAADTVGASTIIDRSDLQVGQDSNEKVKSRSGVGNATMDREKLVDRSSKNSSQKDKSGNVTSIDGVRNQRLEGEQNLSNVPLADRRKLQDPSREVASAMERPELRDIELTDRTHSGRNINRMNQHSHEDRINEQQNNQLTERKAIERNMEHKVSQDITNRERNINETNNRHFIHNENNEHITNNVTERNNTVTEVNRRVQENTTERESISKEVNRHNEQIVKHNEHTHTIKIDPSVAPFAARYFAAE